jgi:hypothetical protein
MQAQREAQFSVFSKERLGDTGAHSKTTQSATEAELILISQQVETGQPLFISFFGAWPKPDAPDGLGWLTRRRRLRSLVALPRDSRAETPRSPFSQVKANKEKMVNMLLQSVTTVGL